MTKAEFKKRIQIITAISIVVLLTAAIILIGQVISIISLNNKKAALQAELNTYQKEHILIEQELEYRESAKYAEQYAREVLGLVKKGDEVYKIEEE